MNSDPHLVENISHPSIVLSRKVSEIPSYIDNILKFIKICDHLSKVLVCFQVYLYKWKMRNILLQDPFKM